MTAWPEVFTVHSDDGDAFELWFDKGVKLQSTAFPVFPVHLTREKALELAAVLTKLAASETAS